MKRPSLIIVVNASSKKAGLILVEDGRGVAENRFQYVAMKRLGYVDLDGHP